MIKLNNFSKAYKKSIFCNTTVSFPDNKVNFIMGRNGSGKTTLFKCIAGLEAYNGEIKFDENDISEAREKMFVLWDDTPFYQNLSGIKNILLFSNDKIKKNDIYKISETYLDYSTMKREVKTYSYGQKKKLALILLDILKPKYILMDEISNGLDIDMMNVLCKKIEELKKQSTIILT
ncbi:MAG: ATP-binding cassette domain-containing protein, partial [Ruminococcus sp.]|nr:ATP-binding cassette domain-containing protein [Ruminococcus sp.]